MSSWLHTHTHTVTITTGPSTQGSSYPVHTLPLHPLSFRKAQALWPPLPRGPASSLPTPCTSRLNHHHHHPTIQCLSFYFKSVLYYLPRWADNTSKRTLHLPILLTSPQCNPAFTNTAPHPSQTPKPTKNLKSYFCTICNKICNMARHSGPSL
jgi:hypothetical protein